MRDKPVAARQALDDDDRYPWLAAIADWIRARGCGGEGGVVSCSALTYCYRNLLRQAYAEVWFLHLDADRDLITHRVSGRSDHFHACVLSGLAVPGMEPLRPDEADAVVDASASSDDIVRTVVARLGGCRWA